MRTFKLLPYCLLIALSYFFSVNYTHAQWQNDPSGGSVGSLDITTNMFRNGNVAIGGTNPFPPAIKLYVEGRFTQTFSGTLGGQTFADRWASLGGNFGTTNPTQVYGLIRQWNGRFFTTGIKDGLNAVVAWGGKARLDFDFTDDNNINNTRMSILSGGNVGIGTNSPNTDLSVVGIVRGAFDANELEYTEMGHGGGNGYINTRGDGNLDFRHDGNNQMTLTPTGRLGIGTTSPDRQLSVAGIVRGANSSTELEYTEMGHGGANGYINTRGDGNLDFRHDNITRMRLTSNGRLAINKSAANFNLDVNGTAACTGGFWSSSDKRFKENITGIEGALDKIKALEGVSYNFAQREIGSYNFAVIKDQEYLGFIAQEVEKVMPQLIQKDEDGYYAVNYDGVIPVLVEAIKEQDEVLQEQSNLIEKQQTEMESLQAKVERLESLVNTLVNQSANVEKKELPASSSTAVLKQNIPNPFKNRTTINYELPSNINNADLVVYDLNGKVMQSQAISGKGYIELDASRLANGTYLYAILVEGQSIARKSLVIQK